MKKKSPVVVFFFNREHVERVVQQISAYKPTKLYLVSDGGRNKSEHSLCLKIRANVDKMIDWDCQVIRIYEDRNLGVDVIMPKYITHIFQDEEELIIFEDDCVPDPSFFEFCHFLLEKYRSNKKIINISGTNWFDDIPFTDKSYFFSIHPECYGWATWKESWQLYDDKMSGFKHKKERFLINKVIISKFLRRLYFNLFERHYLAAMENDWKNSNWDGKWLYSSFVNEGLSIVPNKNLVTNIGFDSSATHTKDKGSFLANKRRFKIDLPLKEECEVIANKSYDIKYAKTILGFTFFNTSKIRAKIIIKLMKDKIMKKIFLRIFKKPKWHNLRSVKPISTVFGLDRGTPIDRVYIEHFLEKNQKDISGVVCEIADNSYSKRFGQRISKYEILHYTQDNPKATIIGDLSDISSIPNNKIDCFILTQTLNFIYDFNAAIKGLYHMLNVNGVALVTVAGICQISQYDKERWGDYWRFTDMSIGKAFENVFGAENVLIEIYGNVLTSTAFLQGISAEELSHDELFHNDNNYQLIITVKAIKK